jgi:hypothetical protein
MRTEVTVMKLKVLIRAYPERSCLWKVESIQCRIGSHRQVKNTFSGEVVKKTYTQEMY